MKRLVLFTKMEVVVILVTLAIVFVLSWSNLNRGWRVQRDISRKIALDEISRGLKAYYLVYKHLPSSENNNFFGCGTNGDSPCGWLTRWEDGQHIYLDKIPADPLAYAKNPWPHFGYQTNSDRSEFHLWAFLENADDPDLVTSWQRCPGKWQKNQIVVCGDGKNLE